MVGGIERINNLVNRTVIRFFRSEHRAPLGGADPVAALHPMQDRRYGPGGNVNTLHCGVEATRCGTRTTLLDAHDQVRVVDVIGPKRNHVGELRDVARNVPRPESTSEILALLRGLVFSVNAVIADVGGGGRFAKPNSAFERRASKLLTVAPKSAAMTAPVTPKAIAPSPTL